jgi:peptidoglycan hydrolase-like protein with peptidoglycan-binding domain
MPLTSEFFADSPRVQNAADNNPPLAFSETSDGVRRLQDALLALNYSMPVSTRKGGADGIFGDETAATVRQFQTDNPPLDVDGRAGQNTLSAMDQLLQGIRYQYRGFAPADKATLKADVQKAIDIAKSCANVLAFNRLGLPENIVSLLQDTFNIDGSDPDEVGFLRLRYMNFVGRMDTVTFIYTTEHAPSNENLGYGAFAKSAGPGGILSPNEIYFTKGYFQTQDAFKRAVTILHEYIHLVNTVGGHPGNGGIDNQLEFYARAHIGIDFPYAAVNAYCYEYFAQWLLNP